MEAMELDKTLKLMAQGLMCAQIPLIYALESEDEENSSLIRTLSGLNMGLTDMSGPCGALTGGCCLISYFTGKGDEVELEDPAFKDMISEFTKWFKEKYGSQICIELIDGDVNNTLVRCPEMMQQSYLKAVEILQRNGVV